MFGLENKGKTLIFMSRHFDETMTVLILHFLRFGALKILTGDYFVLRINQIIYRPFSHCIDQAGLGAFTAKSGHKHYNPPPLTVM